MVEELECTKCSLTKPLTAFYKKASGKFGVRRDCKKCVLLTQKLHDETPKGKARLKAYRRTPKYRFISYRSGADERGVWFNLTFDEFLSFWNQSCSYCNKEIRGIGLDRLDNELGYEIDNVVSCCTTCNMAKKCMSVKEYLDHCRRVVEFSSQF